MSPRVTYVAKHTFGAGVFGFGLQYFGLAAPLDTAVLFGVGFAALAAAIAYRQSQGL
jgi:hypothetical protein